MRNRRSILFVQLPIPPAGLQPIRGNVPLAAGYLSLYARRRGLEQRYRFDILPTPLANNLSDQGLVDEILDRKPWMVGFSCYLWNIERTLWIAERLKRARPEIRILLGGPEITFDNRWVLEHPAVDFAALGEGEQTFAELLEVLDTVRPNFGAIAGLHASDRQKHSLPGLNILDAFAKPQFRKPLDNLDIISSPYLEGDLDAAEERMLFLETVRGCIFKCKFCYYPKAYDDLHFLSKDKIRAILNHARERGVTEVVLLDPTLNQRKDFNEFLTMLAECNPGGGFTYFGELRGEGIGCEQARLLKAANFTEVEIGLQSIDPLAQDLMDRKNNLKAFERGAKAMLDVGLKVKVDLIIGLPGDTVDSIRRGIHYLHDRGLHSDIQVFNLAILPGTAFREEALALGLRHQPRPPYYVLETPTLTLPAMYDLMDEAMEIFDTEFDPLPPPILDESSLVPIRLADGRTLRRKLAIDLDDESSAIDFTTAKDLAQAICVWFTSRDFSKQVTKAAECLRCLLSLNPFATLQVVLEPLGNATCLQRDNIETLMQVCLEHPTYLDRLHGLQTGRPNGAKRFVVVIARPPENRDWIASTDELTTVMVRTGFDNGEICYEPLMEDMVVATCA